MPCVDCGNNITLCGPDVTEDDCPEEEALVRNLQGGKSVSGWCWDGKITIEGKAISVFNQTGECEKDCTCNTLYMPYQKDHEALACT